MSWIEESLSRWAWERHVTRVRNVMPDRFEAYARVFHPVEGRRWADLAAEHGRMMHPEAQLETIAPGWSTADWAAPSAEVMAALAEVLVGHTTTPQRCWFARWKGYGDTVGQTTLHCPLQRAYVVVAAPLGAPPHEANLWWPDDRAWCVSTEIDFAWTYVGGTSDAVAAVLGHPDLESLPAIPTDRADMAGDLLNRW